MRCVRTVGAEDDPHEDMVATRLAFDLDGSLLASRGTTLGGPKATAVLPCTLPLLWPHTGLTLVPGTCAVPLAAALRLGLFDPLAIHVRTLTVHVRLPSYSFVAPV
ncbi:hypothetical protein RB195_008486 [Necator americanus]|uniref:Uncharacterized protein n=1 Tax=Necator americanus TaxID=51031 RepID=A0ABR1CNX2_NECAM